MVLICFLFSTHYSVSQYSPRIFLDICWERRSTNVKHRFLMLVLKTNSETFLLLGDKILQHQILLARVIGARNRRNFLQCSVLFLEGPLQQMFNSCSENTNLLTWNLFFFFLGLQSLRSSRKRIHRHKNHQKQKAVLEPSTDWSSLAGAYEHAWPRGKILHR